MPGFLAIAPVAPNLPGMKGLWMQKQARAGSPRPSGLAGLGSSHAVAFPGQGRGLGEGRSCCYPPGQRKKHPSPTLLGPCSLLALGQPNPHLMKPIPGVKQCGVGRTNSKCRGQFTRK